VAAVVVVVVRVVPRLSQAAAVVVVRPGLIYSLQLPRLGRRRRLRLALAVQQERQRAAIQLPAVMAARVELRRSAL
jgi:hypothetical protein